MFNKQEYGHPMTNADSIEDYELDDRKVRSSEFTFFVPDMKIPVDWFYLIFIFCLEFFGTILVHFTAIMTYSKYIDPIYKDQSVLGVSIAQAAMLYFIYSFGKNVYSVSCNTILTFVEFAIKVSFGDGNGKRSTIVKLNDLWIFISAVLGQILAAPIAGLLVFSINGIGSRNMGTPSSVDSLNGFQFWMIQNLVFTVYVVVSVFLSVTKHPRSVEARTFLYCALCIISTPLSGGVIDIGRYATSAIFAVNYSSAPIYISATCSSFVISSLVCGALLLLNRFLNKFSNNGRKFTTEDREERSVTEEDRTRTKPRLLTQAY